ncbi:hypothetical protein D3C83_31570 [compost metagenome]
MMDPPPEAQDEDHDWDLGMRFAERLQRLDRASHIEARHQKRVRLGFLDARAGDFRRSGVTNQLDTAFVTEQRAQSEHDDGVLVVYDQNSGSTRSFG